VAVGVKHKRPEADKVVVEEHLTFLSSFFHKDILCRQGVDSKYLYMEMKMKIKIATSIYNA
jgi:hypothetical protein